MKVIAITGASSGIGRSTALAFARKGASIGLIARNEKALHEVHDEVVGAGGKAIVIACDVSEIGALDNAAARIEEELGPMDVWINCAMSLVFARFEDITAEEYRRISDVNYHGYVYGTKAALRYMKPRNRGQVIQIGSALSHRSVPLQAAYCASKHAVRGFTNAVRAELMHEKYNLAITMVELPAINTPLYSWGRAHLEKKPRPLAPVYSSALASEAIVWVAEHPQREIWVGWIVWAVVLGEKVFPGLLDHYMAKEAWKKQVTDEALEPDRKDNLFKSVEGGHKEKGEFTDEEITKKPLLWTVPNQNFWVNSFGFGLILLGFLLGLLFG